MFFSMSTKQYKGSGRYSVPEAVLEASKKRYRKRARSGTGSGRYSVPEAGRKQVLLPTIRSAIAVCVAGIRAHRVSSLLIPARTVSSDRMYFRRETVLSILFFF